MDPFIVGSCELGVCARDGAAGAGVTTVGGTGVVTSAGGARVVTATGSTGVVMATGGAAVVTAVGDMGVVTAMGDAGVVTAVGNAGAVTAAGDAGGELSGEDSVERGSGASTGGLYAVSARWYGAVHGVEQAPGTVSVQYIVSCWKAQTAGQDRPRLLQKKK